MPRVGSSSSSTFIGIDSQRPRMAFCWLPPERYRIFCAAFGVLTRIAWICRSALPFSQPSRNSQPKVECAARALMLMFSATLASGMMPSFLRSSGHSNTPAAMASRGERNCSACPHSSRLPALARSRPLSKRNSSVRPAPTSPNRPRISPLRTWKLIGSRSPGPSRPSTLSATSPCSRGR
ncbi:hypothetical protein PSSY5922_31395 [Pseudomonas synxantha]